MTINLLAEALADYNKALRLGKREGKSLPVLDDILKEKRLPQQEKFLWDWYRFPQNSWWEQKPPEEALRSVKVFTLY